MTDVLHATLLRTADCVLREQMADELVAARDAPSPEESSLADMEDVEEDLTLGDDDDDDEEEEEEDDDDDDFIVEDGAAALEEQERDDDDDFDVALMYEAQSYFTSLSYDIVLAGYRWTGTDFVADAEADAPFTAAMLEYGDETFQELALFHAKHQSRLQAALEQSPALRALHAIADGALLWHVSHPNDDGARTVDITCVDGRTSTHVIDASVRKAKALFKSLAFLTNLRSVATVRFFRIMRAMTKKARATNMYALALAVGAFASPAEPELGYGRLAHEYVEAWEDIDAHLDKLGQ